MYSEQDLQRAAELRDEIHNKALERVRAVYPDADSVIDRYPVEAYFQQVWDYPAKWYTMVALPEGAGSRNDLIGTIVRDTLMHCRNSGGIYNDDAFYRLIAGYPDIACKYCIITKACPPEKTGNIFPYSGVFSHMLALGCAAFKLSDGGHKWSYDLDRARSRKLKGKALFAPVGSDEWLNYRKAFRCPPDGNSYSDNDFERVNNVLFPAGESVLEVYRWTTDWSDYFDGDDSSRGTLCLTVYDNSLERFVVIMASAGDPSKKHN